MEFNVTNRLESLPQEMLMELKKLLNKDSAMRELEELIENQPISIENGKYQITFQSINELKKAKKFLNEEMQSLETV